MLGKLFAYIRRQPKAVRKRYALGFATTFTGLVAMIWFVTGDTFNFTTNNIAESENKESSPFSTITKQAKEQLANLSGSLSDETDEEDNESFGETDGQSGDIQVSQDPTEIVLSEEDLRSIRQKEQNVAGGTVNSSSTMEHKEVLIATTTKSVDEDADSDELETGTSTDR